MYFPSREPGLGRDSSYGATGRRFQTLLDLKNRIGLPVNLGESVQPADAFVHDIIGHGIAAQAVYGPSLNPGATRADFVAAGLIDP